jgi:hypothetical protein
MFPAVHGSAGQQRSWTQAAATHASFSHTCPSGQATSPHAAG